jgi:tetratricopeptide (TPR) repeat protein
MSARSHLLRTTVLVGLTAFLPATVLGQSDLQTGINAYYAGDFSKASVDLENYIRIRPDDRLAYDYLAKAYVKLGDNTRAIDALERALKMFPGEVAFRGLLGQLYAAVEKYDDAEKQLAAYRNVNPTDTAITRLLAGVLLARGVNAAQAARWKEAAEFFDRSIGLDSTAEAAHVNLAIALANAKEFKRAAVIEEKAIRRFPGNLALRKIYAATLIGLDDYAKARGVLEEYQKLNPNDVEAGLQLAALYRNLNAADRALVLYDALIVRHPKDRRAYEALIQYWSNYFRYDKIRETYERLAREDPSDMMLLKSIAGTYEKEKKWGEARNVYRQWIERDSLNPEPRLAVASTFRRDSNETAAASELEKLFRIAPQHERALTMMGDILEKEGRLDSARELYARFIEWHPNNARPYHRIGVVYDRLGVTDSARSALERAYTIDPADPYPIAELAAVASSTGDSISALKLYRRTLAATLRSMQRQQQQLVTQMQAEKDRMGLDDLQQLSLAGEGFSGLRDLYGLCLDALRRGMTAQSFNAMLDDYLREYPTSIVLLLAEGEWYEREGASERALEIYTRILNINPAVVQAITAMARLHEQNGDLESAILDHRRLQSIDAANTAAYDGLLRLHGRLGRLDELCDEWKRLYAVRSDDKILKERLIEALHKANRREEARNLTH